MNSTNRVWHHPEGLPRLHGGSLGLRMPSDWIVRAAHDTNIMALWRIGKKRPDGFRVVPGGRIVLGHASAVVRVPE